MNKFIGKSLANIFNKFKNYFAYSFDLKYE